MSVKELDDPVSGGPVLVVPTTGRKTLICFSTQSWFGQWTWVLGWTSVGWLAAEAMVPGCAMWLGTADLGHACHRSSICIKDWPWRLFPILEQDGLLLVVVPLAAESIWLWA